jgi:hypothetical protein
MIILLVWSSYFVKEEGSRMDTLFSNRKTDMVWLCTKGGKRKNTGIYMIS